MSNNNQIHHVFKTVFNGIARELITDGIVYDPLLNKQIALTKVIWDTGATNSVINEKIAQQFGLIPTGQIQQNTANGGRIANTYVVNVILPNGVQFAELNISDGDLGAGTEMLIGMDIIASGDFTVQNYDGKTHFSFCMPAFENKYDMLEKAYKINLKIQKSINRNQKK